MGINYWFDDAPVRENGEQLSGTERVLVIEITDWSDNYGEFVESSISIPLSELKRELGLASE